MRTANPALRTSTFADLRDNLQSRGDERPRTMSIQGAINRTGLLLVLALGAAAYTWSLLYSAGMGAVYPFLIGGVIGGFVLALITIFKPTFSPVTAPLYAVAQGLALGGISAAFNQQYPGLPLQAVALTFGVLFVMLALYTTRIIKPTQRFMAGVAAATGAVALVYVMSFVLGMFGVAVPFIHSNGLIGIGFSLAVVVIAALNLVLDFHTIEEGAEMGAPKVMEWYAAFGLLVTLVWLYLEMLRLLSKLRSR